MLLAGASGVEVVTLVGIAAVALAVALTYRTRVWWLPGMALLAGAGVLGWIASRPAHDDDYGLQGMGDFFVLAGASVVALVGVLLLVFAANARRFRA